MSGPFGSHNFMSKGTPPEGGQSLRFNDDDSAYLSWTPSAAGNRKTWTWSGWVKRGNLGLRQAIFTTSNSAGDDYIGLEFSAGDTLLLSGNNGSGSVQLSLTTNAVFRDPSAWYHVVINLDTTQATSTDRAKVYVNGVLQTFSSSTYPPLNYDSRVNTTNSHNISSFLPAANLYLDGYMSEVNFVDGQALDPTSFGKTDANGQWVPIKNPSVTYGTNGFYLPFTNDYEVEGFNTVTYRGNGGTQYIGGVGFDPDMVWIKSRSTTYDHQVYDTVRGPTKRVFPNKTNAELTGSDLVQSFDTDGFTVGTNVGLNSSSHTYVAWTWDMGTVENLVTNGDFDQDISGWSTTQGTVTWDSERRAYLQGPSGVTFTQTITGLDTSKTYYYTARLTRTSGTGNFGVDVDGTLDYVSGSSYTNYTASGFFTPSATSIDFDVWGGSGLYLYADDIQIFEANTDGSITSSVKANQTYGQSIVSYTGTAADNTVGHGLSQAPEVIIFKNRDAAYEWTSYFSELGATKYVYLNRNYAAGTYNHFQDTDPTSSVFYLEGTAANSVNGSGQDMIAYCFHSVAGYSDFGSYTGNGSSTGPTVTTGFKPAFVMIKRTDYTAGWIMFDNTRTPYNPLDKYLRADSSAADVTASAYKIDFNSDGFQLKGTGNDINQSSGTYIYMAFADKREAAFWLDQSGNNNDWTNNNMQESDISLDSPTNNFATLNALANYTGGSLSEGNLRVSSGSSQYGPAVSTFAQSSGKWYAEFSSTSTSGDTRIGAVRVDTALSTTYDLGNSGSFAYRQNDGNKKIDGTQSAYGATWAASDIIGIALNLDDNEVTFYKNNTSQGTFSITAGEYFIAISDGDSGAGGNYLTNFGQDSSFAGNEVAQGNTDENGFGDFYYEPPAGYLALCTQNLPDPAINDGSDHFNTVLYTGNGTSQSITGVGFQPSLLWLKGRSSGTLPHYLQDEIRGANNTLTSNSTAAEFTSWTGHSFDSDGFTVDASYSTETNSNGNTYVAWNWKAGGTGVANTDGSISSTVSANTTAGFSIVTYSGNGTAGATIGHGLSSAPEIIITKNRDYAYNWWTYVSELGAGNSVLLNTTSASYADTTLWNNTAPTASVFSVGTALETNRSGSDILAYCFHSVEGYSKVGSFTGNGSTNGTFVYTGFKPAFILWKRSSSTSNWLIWDNTRSPYNVVDDVLFPDISNAESSSAVSYGIDMLSNGFKLRNSNATVNGSGSTYIYMAFAENPFKYSNAR